MVRTLELIDKRPYVVVGATRRGSTEVPGLNLKAGEYPRACALGERAAQMIVNHGLERLTGTPRFGLKARGDVIFKSQCRSHTVMLSCMHQDVYHGS